MKKTATKFDWKTKPMPNKNAVIEFEKVISSEGFKKISQGFIPKDMDDKWFSYTENNIISFHRSWTGNCIFQAHCIPQENNEVNIYKLVANRKEEEYTNNDIEYDKNLLNQLIENFFE